MTSILWFRRDLRLRDNPALRAAAEARSVLGLFVLDPGLWGNAGPARRAWLAANLHALDESMNGRLCLRLGKPASVVPAVSREIGAAQLHVTGDFSPYGRARDRAVAAALPEDVRGVATGTPYAVPPGTLRNGSGTAFKVFTPYSKAWRAHGWDDPVQAPDTVSWLELAKDQQLVAMLDAALADAPAGMADAGEEAAWRRVREFMERDLNGYSEQRNYPGADRTSRVSAHLKYGVLHPRQLLCQTAGHKVRSDRPAGPEQWGPDQGGPGHAGPDQSGRPKASGPRTYETELAWRDFYADVLFHHPASAWKDLRPLPGMTYDDSPELADDVDAWRSGRTGFPIVDAGMRQLLAQGWMHNRVRMITASFLTKDLHAWWPVGARHFLDHLIDGDLASNNHGWQWVAGTGTDAAPYFRVFNPVTQGLKFDASGDYVRRWVPELAHLQGKAVHEPWDAESGYAKGYPRRIIDHARERRVALDRYQLGRE